MSSYQINKFLQLKRLRYLDIRFSQLTPFVSIVTLLGRHNDISEDLQYWRTQEGGKNQQKEREEGKETKEAGRPNTRMERAAWRGKENLNCQAQGFLWDLEGTYSILSGRNQHKPDNKVFQCIRLMITKPQNSEEGGKKLSLGPPTILMLRK